MLFASAAGGSSGNGGNFLIPNGTFVVELVIFLVVLGVIAKWILPPLQQVGDARRVRIRTALEQAEAARAETQGVLAERDRILSEARTQARGIIDHANQDADAALDQGRARGQEEYAVRVEASRREISGECGRAREELTMRLDSLVVAAAERVLGNHVEQGRYRQLIDEAVEGASAAGPVGGAV